MKLALLLLLASFSLSAQENLDLLIRNGKIMDGTGNPWFYGDIGIREGRIVQIGNLGNASAKRIIDATGLMVSPGFIDVHTHIEGDEAKTPTADNFIYDGVTTVITGNCGSSKVDIHQYLDLIDSIKLSINVATLVGHSDIRKAVMGSANRSPTEEEIKKMEELVSKAMLDGAVGFSTGLIYIPGTYAKTEEIIRLAKIAAFYNGVYSTHMRYESDSVAQGIEEALQIGRQAKIPVEISHFKVSGQQNWSRSGETIALVKQARQEGIEVTIDQYPYTASSTSLSTLLPESVLADGPDSVKARLSRADVRQYVIESMLKSLKKRKLKHFSYAVVAYYGADTTLNGKSIEEINLIKGKKHRSRYEAETIIDMMTQGGAGMVFHGMSEGDVKNIMQFPFNMFASDAGIRTYGMGVPHPRGYGTNARVLGKYVREENIIILEEAIRRMTSLPAQKFKLSGHGLLSPGYVADIVLFDAAVVQDLSTFERPHAYSKGFIYVIVNGQLVIDQGKHTGVRSGKALRGVSYQR